MFAQYSKIWRIAAVVTLLGVSTGCAPKERDDVALSSIKANDPHPAGNIGTLGDTAPNPAQRAAGK